MALLAVDDAYLNRVVGVLLESGQVVPARGVPAGSGTTPDLEAVLIEGNDAGGLDVVGVGLLDAAECDVVDGVVQNLWVQNDYDQTAGNFSFDGDLLLFNAANGWQVTGQGWGEFEADLGVLINSPGSVAIETDDGGLNVDAGGLTLGGSVTSALMNLPFASWDAQADGAAWAFTDTWHVESTSEANFIFDLGFDLSANTIHWTADQWIVDTTSSHFEVNSFGTYFVNVNDVDWHMAGAAFYASQNMDVIVAYNLGLYAGTQGGVGGGILVPDVIVCTARWPDNTPTAGQVLTVASVTDPNNIVLEWA